MSLSLYVRLSPVPGWLETRTNLSHMFVLFKENSPFFRLSAHVTLAFPRLYSSCVCMRVVFQPTWKTKSSTPRCWRTWGTATWPRTTTRSPLVSSTWLCSPERSPPSSKTWWGRRTGRERVEEWKRGMFLQTSCLYQRVQAKPFWGARKERWKMKRGKRSCSHIGPNLKKNDGVSWKCKEKKLSKSAKFVNYFNVK